MCNIGENIKKARIKKGLTQKDFANLIGKAPNTITQIESEIGTKKYLQLKEICQALNVSADEILGLEKETKYKTTPEGEKLIKDYIEYIEKTYPANKEDAELTKIGNL